MSDNDDEDEMEAFYALQAAGFANSRRRAKLRKPKVPDDHEAFEALRNYGLKALRRVLEKRRRKPTGA